MGTLEGSGGGATWPSPGLRGPLRRLSGGWHPGFEALTAVQGEVIVARMRLVAVGDEKWLGWGPILKTELVGEGRV